jgi:hypothetical protein
MPNIMHTQKNTEFLLRQILTLLEKLGDESIQNGYFLPISSADADAPLNSIYYSTDSSKLVYKDSGGTINDLY